jgi:dihydrofolate synthase / folylpolyglutamate synthase
LKTYQEVVSWMFSKLPMYQRVGIAAYRPGLERMQSLDVHLGEPHKSFKSIHVAGTNGKGSTSSMIAAALQCAGYRVGLYTSPHLLDFRERIKINGEKIPEVEVIHFVHSHQNFFEENQVSFFEMTVGLAYSYFQKASVDFAVIEVGLGGRLDATNIILPILSVITTIGLDHTEILGSTRALIAREKAGIIKENVPVVIGQKDIETQEVFEEIAQSKNSPLYYAETLSGFWETDLKGSYQNENMRTAIQALKRLSIENLTPEHIQEGLRNVISKTGFQGRWQVIAQEPYTVLDVGHNAEGLTEIAKQLKTSLYEKLYIVLGFVQGKNVQELIALLPSEAHFYISAPQLARALSVENIQMELKTSPLDIQYYKTVAEAYNEAKSVANQKDMILVCGSTFVVAEVMEYLQEKN